MSILTILCFVLLLDINAQNYEAIERALIKTFRKNSFSDESWVFYPDSTYLPNGEAIKVVDPVLKIESNLVRERVPNFELFKVKLTLYLGWHGMRTSCLLLFDSTTSKILLVKPLWFAGISNEFAKLLIGQKFKNKDMLISFMVAVNDLMIIGSWYKIRFTGYTDTLITYDLIRDEEVLRKIEVSIKNLKIIKYIIINPRLNDREIIK